MDSGYSAAVLGGLLGLIAAGSLAVGLTFNPFIILGYAILAAGVFAVVAVILAIATIENAASACGYNVS